MSAGTFLQVVGAFCELGGLVTVASGIADTRERFGLGPSILRRALAQVVRAAAKLLGRRLQTAVVEGAVSMMGSASIKARGTVSFGPWDDVAVEERIERLKRAVENHDRILTELDGRIDGEETARRESDERHERHVEEVHRELTDLIKEATAGGLRLQTFGVLLFAFGVSLGLTGNLMRYQGYRENGDSARELFRFHQFPMPTCDLSRDNRKPCKRATRSTLSRTPCAT